MRDAIPDQRASEIRKGGFSSPTGDWHYGMNGIDKTFFGWTGEERTVYYDDLSTLLEAIENNTVEMEEK